LNLRTERVCLLVGLATTHLCLDWAISQGASHGWMRVKVVEGAKGDKKVELEKAAEVVLV